MKISVESQTFYTKTLKKYVNLEWDLLVFIYKLYILHYNMKKRSKFVLRKLFPC